MGYLHCQSCGGYYHLEDDESPQDFDGCQCGGELVYTPALDPAESQDEPDWEYGDDEDDVYTEEVEHRRTSQKKLIIIMTPILVLMVVGASLTAAYLPPLSTITGNDASVLGSDSRGTVTKEVLGSSSATSTIAVVTGIHPREKLSRRAVSGVVDGYQLKANQQIVHYDIEVTKSPQDYYLGRKNGEGLAAQYVLPDILKNNYDVVLVCHNHVPGYGTGFYLATPKMDAGSVALAVKLEKILPDFNYYRATSSMEPGTSTLSFTGPVANAGYRTLVYEIPDLAGNQEAPEKTKELIGAIFSTIY
jgi:hypothetical protein